MNRVGYYLEKFWYYILYSLMLFPILPRGVESTLMIIFFVISVLIWVKKRTLIFSIIEGKDILIIILFSSIFFVYVVSLMYTTNIQEGVNRVIKVLPIIMFPLIFWFFRKDISLSRHFNQLTNVYLFALAIGLFFLHIVFFNELYFLESTHRQIRQGIENITDIHGTYLSIWIGFGVFILISKIEHRLNFNKFKKIILYIALTAYFIYWQITIGARAPVVMTVILGMLFFIIKKKMDKRLIVSFSLILTVFLFFLVTSKSNIVNRIVTVFSFEQSFPEGDYSTEYKKILPEDIRKGIYFCSWFITKQSPWIGHGIGDVQEKLDNCYEEKFNTNTYQIFKFNSHNQYLQVLLSSGIFALLLFLSSLIIPLYLAWQQSNYLWFLFTLFIMGCFLTENVIDRHDGVIFYSIFNSILIYNNLKINEKSINP